MPVITRNRDGRYEAVIRRDAAGLPVRILRALPAGAGLGFLAAAALALAPAPGPALLAFAAAGTFPALAAYALLAAASRRDLTVLSLHVATGELRLRTGRGLFAKRRALGSVEVDRLRIERRIRDGICRFRLDARLHGGECVPLIRDERDEAAVRDVALTLSQGAAVPLEDLRYETGPGGARPPARVEESGEERRRVYSWGYRDRFRPRLVLLGLGLLAAGTAGLPRLGSGPVLVLPSVCLVLLGFLLGSHVLACLTTRRLILRDDAVRVERSLGALSLLRRMARYAELKAVLVLGRGSRAVLHLRLAGGRPGVVLPFEEPSVAGWMKRTIERAAHSAGRRSAGLPDVDRGRDDIL